MLVMMEAPTLPTDVVVSLKAKDLKYVQGAAPATWGVPPGP